jgi:CRISPR-associated endonuclease Csn1
LQSGKLLPSGNNREKILTDLTKELIEKYRDQNASLNSDISNVITYYLRSKALNERLEAYELGLAFYNLNQRRGFLSNRKSVSKNDEESGKVKAGIKELATKLESSGFDTLGQMFTSLNTHEERIRGRWTGRQMYEEEFNLIWESQSKYHRDILREDYREKLFNAIFFQRPLKNQKFLVGECELEPNRKRAPKSCFEFQKVRYLQTLNNLKFINQDTGELKILTENERSLIIAELERSEKVTFAQIKKLLKLKGNKWKVNYEDGGENKMFGNVTAARLRKVIGERWDDLTYEQKSSLYEDVISIEKDETLKRRAQRMWGLSSEQAQELSEVVFEPDYGNLSRQAIRKIMPYLEEGLTFAEAKIKAYPSESMKFELFDKLPPLTDRRIPQSLKVINNPVVIRSLSEVRKVVNSLINKYGKPETVRIELARDRKLSRREKDLIAKKNKIQEKKRVDAATVIKKGTGLSQPSREDIEKYLLWEEANHICPYTGKAFAMSDLFNGESVEIEHIIPRSISFDNSFKNKTICATSENRNKRNRTPYDAYHTDEDRWDKILERVGNFNSDFKNEKLRRFMMTPEDVQESYENFTNRQLNDTRYATVLARDYCGLLYGGFIDNNKKIRVQATSGGITYDVRIAHNLNSLLNDGGYKTREDHRHHAVDALAVALTDAKTIKKLSTGLKKAEMIGSKSTRIDDPWKGFRKNVEEVLSKVITSYKLDRRVRGQLHEETNYHQNKEEITKFHFRKPVFMLNEKELDRIADDRIKSVVKNHIKSLINSDSTLKVAAAIKSLESKPPLLKSKDGKKVTPIKKVRLVAKNSSMIAVGSNKLSKFVESSEYHHLEIFIGKNKKGDDVYQARPINMLEAYNRRSRHEEIINREWDGKKFCNSLSKGDIVEWNNSLWLLRTTMINKSRGDNPVFKLSEINDARLDKAIPLGGRQPTLSSIPVGGLRKCIVDYLGNLSYSND